MTLHFVGGPSPMVVAAYQMVMLAEITGIPPVTNHMTLFDDGLKAAAKALAADEPWLASQLAIRLGTSDNSLGAIGGDAEGRTVEACGLWACEH